MDHGDGDVDLVNGTVQGADQTAVVLIDEHNPNNLIEAADLWAKVTASNDNDFPTDGGRNYRIDHQQATDWAVGYSTRVTKTISYKTDRLINLGEFELTEGDTVLIWVTAPVTFPLTLGLAPPTSGSDKADSALGNVHLDKGFLPEGSAGPRQLLHRADDRQVGPGYDQRGSPGVRSPPARRGHGPAGGG